MRPMMNSTKSLHDQIIETTQVQRHNGTCAVGEWLPLADAAPAVQMAVADEIDEAIASDMRQETPGPNTDEAGMVVVAGNTWIYDR